jgi:hypothetical protein
VDEAREPRKSLLLTLSCKANFAIQSAGMIDRSQAEEHLRVIRSLMEKATIYRAISAEAAAVGGVLALLASFAFGNWVRDRDWGEVAGTGLLAPVPRWQFFALWMAVLALAAGVNFWILWRGAKSRGEPFVSPGMRLALQALLPSYFVAAVFTVALSGVDFFAFTVPIWMLCHGLGLLSTTFFAPRSLPWLGASFLAVGLFSFWSIARRVFAPILSVGGITIEQGALIQQWQCLYSAQQWMALSFGLLHLIYAACTWPRRAR